MRRSSGEPPIRLMLVWIVCAAALSAVSLAAATAPGATAEGDAPIGYRVEGGAVVFTFDPASYDFATRGDTGGRVDLANVAIGAAGTVAVAGEFNGWSTDAWPMEVGQGGVYELRRPVEEFAGRDSWPFKFVIDDLLWVEPPSTAPNVVPTGLGNNSLNLLLVLQRSMPPRAEPPGPPGGEPPAQPPPEPVGSPAPERGDSPLLERLTPPPETLAGSCTLKRMEDAVGAMPIRVTSNPMITSDRRVIGFLSVFVMPPTPEEEARWEAQVADTTSGGRMKSVEELMEERTANVRAAYVAVYQGETSTDETGVFALEFIDPLSPERQAQLAVEGPGGAVLTSDHVAAAVWSDDRDRSCFDAVLSFVRTALSE
jgi:hypothetical protein